MNLRDSVWKGLPIKKLRRSHCGKGFQLVESSQCCAQVRSHAHQAMKIRDAKKEQCTKNGRELEKLPAWLSNQSKEQEVARGMGSPRLASNWRRRTREGPEPACVLSSFLLGWHTQEGRANKYVLAVAPSSRRWKYTQLVPLSRGGKTGLPVRVKKKGKWSPRGTGTTVLTCPFPTARRYRWQ